MSRLPHDSPSESAEISTDKDAAKVDSSELLDASGRLVIYHRGEQYQLRQTRAEKLILTKLRPSD